MASMEYARMRTETEARAAEQARLEQQRRSAIVLMLHHMQREGFGKAVHALESDSGVSMDRYEVCDNVDLLTVIQEFEAYYSIKYNRPPKLIRKLGAPTEEKKKKPASKPGALPKLESATDIDKQESDRDKDRRRPHSTGTGPTRAAAGPAISSVSGPGAMPSPAAATAASATSAASTRTTQARGLPGRAPLPPAGQSGAAIAEESSSTSLADMGLSGTAITAAGSGAAAAVAARQAGRGPPQIVDVKDELRNVLRNATQEAMTGVEDRLLKPVSGLGWSGELRELANVISRDILTRDPNVRWSDIIGLDKACRLSKEAVVYPIRYPQLFSGILSPWKGLLLYGPPGTGKTMLAKAIATECNTTFFNISASSIVSKWRGDSEKLVRVLFELARYHAPSTIFLDELDSIMSARGGDGGGSDHEGSRRLKTELLIQMDGLAKSDDLVFVLGASNLPWELDPAMLRRLEKRILVDLPTLEAREAMFRSHLPPVAPNPSGIDIVSNIDYPLCAEATEGYSGSDIKLVCKEAAMRVLRRVFDRLENASGELKEQVRLDPITTEDVQAALRSTKPSARALQDRYLKWQAEFESVMS
eukprot:m.124273 g.124273  ORF g.124273 m.124273 type:complete len:590 (+) comp14646_c0_seq4:136-1905(+)